MTERAGGKHHHTPHALIKIYRITYTRILCCYFLVYSGNDGGKRERYSTPGVMDLLLISLEPLDLYEKTATSGARGRSISAEKVKAQKVALGLLVANNTANSSGSGGRSSQILVRTEAWQVLKDNCQDKHTSTYTASSKGSSSSMKNSALGKV